MIANPTAVRPQFHNISSRRHSASQTQHDRKLVFE
jgi:hypothetical protein